MNKSKLNKLVRDCFLASTSTKYNEAEISWLCASVRQIFLNEKTVLYLDPPIHICGDLHGQFNDLLRIFQLVGTPPNATFLFLGDYIDRGKNGCEVIILLYVVKCLYPENVYLIRGNHEFNEMTERYGFKEECDTRFQKKKDGKNFYQKVVSSFKYLPVCSILNDRIFCVHGGISSLVVDRQHLNFVRKVGSSLTSFDQIQTEFLWSDPNNSVLEYGENPKRKRLKIDFKIFGKNALKSFLKNNNFDFVIRSHEFCERGFNWPFGESEKLLTIFSSLNYCEGDNRAAVALISDDNKVSVLDFDMNST